MRKLTPTRVSHRLHDVQVNSYRVYIKYWRESKLQIWRR